MMLPFAAGGDHGRMKHRAIGKILVFFQRDGGL
jgi:hypothetical protein